MLLQQPAPAAPAWGIPPAVLTMQQASFVSHMGHALLRLRQHIAVLNVAKDGNVWFMALHNYCQAASKISAEVYLLLPFAMELVIVWKDATILST